MSLFDEGQVQALCARLLSGENPQGCSLNSRHGRELMQLLQAVDGLKPVGRSARYVLTDAGRTYLGGQLAQGGPSMPDKREQLQALGVALPSSLNQASFNALWYGDSKHQHRETHLHPLGDRLTLTQDEVIRLRTQDPLWLIDLHGQHHDMTAPLALLGELSLPERGLARLSAIHWQGTQVITVENKGAFVDYPLTPGQLLLFAPGRNTTLAKRLIPLLPVDVQWAHFGDLDQRGIDIAVELASGLQRPAMLWLPRELASYLAHYARPVPKFAAGSGKIPWRWPPSADDAAVQRSHPWLATLMAQACWLEQEVLLTATHWQGWPLQQASE